MASRSRCCRRAALTSLTARARELGISRVLQGRSDKGARLRRCCRTRRSPAKTADSWVTICPICQPMRAAGFCRHGRRRLRRRAGSSALDHHRIPAGAAQCARLRNSSCVQRALTLLPWCTDERSHHRIYRDPPARFAGRRQLLVLAVDALEEDRDSGVARGPGLCRQWRDADAVRRDRAARRTGCTQAS